MKFLYENLFVIIFIANMLLSLIIVFRERKQTAQTWSWLLVLMFIPVLGFILYIFLGRGISKDKIFDMKMQPKIGMNAEIESEKQSLLRGLFPHPATGDVDPKQLIYMLTVFESSLYTTNNELFLYTDGREKFDGLIKDIREAEHHIHMEYYIYRGDNLGKELRQELVDALKRGVKVRLLLDAWGSTQVNMKFLKSCAI